MSAVLGGLVAILALGATHAAPGPEYTYRLVSELTGSEFQKVNRLCGIAFNRKGHTAWIRIGSVNLDGTSDFNARQLWFHDGLQARLLWSSSAANFVAGQDEFYPDCSGTANTGGGSAVALNDDDLLAVKVQVRAGAPSNQPGQDPPEFYLIDARQDPAPIVRAVQAASGSSSAYGDGINLNGKDQLGLGTVRDPGTLNDAWVLTATDGISSTSGSFAPLDAAWAAATLINEPGWVVSSFGRGSGCPAGAGCSVLLSVLDPTRNDAARLREIAVGTGSDWMGGGGVQRGLGFNNRGLVSIQGVGNQAACYEPRLSVFDVGLDPMEYLVAGVGTPIQMREPGGCGNTLVSGTAMNDWNHLVFGADTQLDGVNNQDVWLADVSGNPFRRAFPAWNPADPTSSIDVGGGRTIRLTDNRWIGAQSLNEQGQIAINTWFRDAQSGTGQQGILIATPCEGCSPGNPALPLEALPGRGWRFSGCRWTVESSPVTPGQPVQCGAWQDPALAIGYAYAVEGDGPKFATVMIPVPLPNGDDSFAVEFDGHVFPLAAGQVFRFTDHSPAGVAAFRISGIGLDEELDPTDPTAFVARVTHVASVDTDFTITMIPLTQDDTPIASFTLKSAVVAGCKTVSGTVTLSEPAPATGAVVTVADTLVAAGAPATLSFAPGARSRTFAVKTLPVFSDEVGVVSVTLGPQTLNQPLRLRPMGLQSLSLSPTSVTGGANVAGVAKIECKAGPGPITVDLSSSDTSAAFPTLTSVIVPVGANSAAFAVATNPVMTKVAARIAGTAGGITKTRAVTVAPAASVSPSSLRFGSVGVGMTSATLNVTLSNRGATEFPVSSINLTGAYSSWFKLVTDCPASLAAGASCSIGVSFSPPALGSKSAKLSIATGATLAPLEVVVSGTGVSPAA